MTALYLFAVAAGLPLVAWFVLSGSEHGDGGDTGGDGGGDGGDQGIGALMFRLLPLNTVALATAAFGICGLALEVAGTATVPTFVAALVAGVVGGVLNTTAFSYLRRSESTASISEHQLAGSIGRIVVPVGPGRRGRVALSVNGQQINLSAEALPSPSAAKSFAVGDAVLVVEVHQGIATVSPLDPELT